MYAENHLLMRWHGHFGTIVAEFLEYFSYGVRLQIGQTGPLTEAKKVAFLAAASVPAVALHTASANAHHGSAFLDKLTCAYIGPDGFYVGGDEQPTTEYLWSGTNVGAGGRTVPYSNAVVYTLRSTIDRGPGRNGRFYVPSGRLVDSSGRWTANECQTSATNVAGWLDQINTAAKTVWGSVSAIAVMSNVGQGKIGTVTQVGVGRAPDTQRRRDNRLLEEHKFAALGTTRAIQDAKDARQYA